MLALSEYTFKIQPRDTFLLAKLCLKIIWNPKWKFQGAQGCHANLKDSTKKPNLFRVCGADKRLEKSSGLK